MKHFEIHFKRLIRNNPGQQRDVDFYSDGHIEWWFNGKIHREDAPAIEWKNGYKEWYLEGFWYREEKDYWEALKKYKKKNTK